MGKDLTKTECMEHEYDLDLAECFLFAIGLYFESIRGGG